MKNRWMLAAALASCVAVTAMSLWRTAAAGDAEFYHSFGSPASGCEAFTLELNFTQDGKLQFKMPRDSSNPNFYQGTKGTPKMMEINFGDTVCRYTVRVERVSPASP